MNEFETHCKKAEGNMLLKHEQELNTLIEQLEEKIQKKPKDSAFLLELRKSEFELAKQKEFLNIFIFNDKNIKVMLMLIKSKLNLSNW